ncbi:hypothetical protein Neosp_002928 [[Neocosmospora] mangrovei]
MVPRVSLLLAFSLVCIESAIAGPCIPGTTSTALTSSETESATSSSASSTTVVTTDSTTSGTDSTTTSLTLTESSTESTTFLSTTSSATVSSESTTLSTSEATTSEATTSLSTQTSATSTSPQPDSTAFNIIPGSDSAASGFLKARTILGGDVYFNNPYASYQTGVFVVNGATRHLIERGSQSICAFFRTGQGYGDLIGCQPDVNPDVQEVPITCQLTASEKIQCSVAGKFCYYQGDMLHCDDRGTYSSLYIDGPYSDGYSVVLGPSGLNLSPVELSAAPIETQ